MTREQLISFLAMVGSVMLFRLVTKLIPPKTLVQRERERLAMELLKSDRGIAKDLKGNQADTAKALKSDQERTAMDLKDSQWDTARDLRETEEDEDS